MNKKALYSILSTIVAMIVLSVSLVFAIGPRVSADSETIGYLDQREFFDINEYGVLGGVTSEGRTYMLGNADIHAYIPTGVKKIIGNEWFGRMGEAHRYSIFYDNYSSDEGYRVTSVVLNSDLEEIGKNAFFNCMGLSGIKIPLQVKSIGWYAFAHSGLKSIIIPASITDMDTCVFDGCENLTTIYCECSEAYANEHWDENWNKTIVYDEEQCDYVGKTIDAEIVWDCNKTITFDTQDGTAVENQVVCVDSLVVKPTAPTKDGYNFLGWYNGDEEYDFATPVSENMTLTAKWEEIQTQPEPETPVEENSAEVNNQNNAGLIWGIAGTAAGILIIAGVVVGIVISKRRRK